ncbi:MAG: glycosyltransferase family 2 protein [Myxococcales bacterium]|nr:glycosyltransferase family 2 protein [Myxococcales bacterium]
MSSLLVSQTDAVGAPPPALRRRLEAWASQRFEPRLFSWTGPEAGLQLTALLSSETFDRIVFFGFDHLRATAVKRALRNSWTPCVVLIDAPERMPTDRRFTVVANGTDEVTNILRARSSPAGPRPSAAPTLSIIVPAWNAARWLERCLASLIHGGDAADLEIIVVDDGSTDATRAIALAFAERFDGVVVIAQANRGHGGAINAGLARARGRYVRVVDADDRVEPEALAALLVALAHESADLVLTDYAEDHEGAPLLAPVKILERLPSGGLMQFEDLVDPFAGVTSWAVLLATSTFRTEVLHRAGVRLTEKSPYVDLEYAVLGLDRVRTIRYRRLPLYVYTLGRPNQTVAAESYRRHFREHEAVLTRLCQFVTERPSWSPQRREYVIERVLNPITAKHVEVLEQLGDRAEAEAFRGRMARFAFLRVPAPRGQSARMRAQLARLTPAWLRRIPRSRRMLSEAVERIASHRASPSASDEAWSFPGPEE